MRRTGENYRRLQIEAIEQSFADRGITDPPVDAETLAMLMSAVARNFVIEGEVGMSLGHQGLRAFIENFLDSLDPIEPIADPKLTEFD
jgi:hypothetical protein